MTGGGSKEGSTRGNVEMKHFMHHLREGVQMSHSVGRKEKKNLFCNGQGCLSSCPELKDIRKVGPVAAPYSVRIQATLRGGNRYVDALERGRNGEK